MPDGRPALEGDEASLPWAEDTRCQGQSTQNPGALLPCVDQTPFGWLVTSRVTVRSLPSRQRVRDRDLPGARPATLRDRSLASLIGCPSTAMIVSPVRTPALAAGPSFMASATRAPLGSLRPMASAISLVTGCICTPMKPRVTEPLSFREATTFSTVLAGMANAIPTLPPDGEKIAVFTPTTSPDRLKVGPPELPLFTEASIWMKSSYGPLPISRCWADTMPAVTVPPRPNGLPIAITQSPIRAFWGARRT